jgi:N-methylhydantoinase A
MMALADRWTNFGRGPQMRFAVDIGGTFTDVVIQDDAGDLWLAKSLSTPDDPALGVLNALESAAQQMGVDRQALLSQGDQLIHGTTRGVNAILTGRVARTVFLTSAGHPDVLVFREGGRERFNLVEEYPPPYIPWSRTFEIPERIGSQGEVVRPLDEAVTTELLEHIRTTNPEAIAVCLLWSIVNPAHELRVGALIEEYLPGVPFTLSHRLNPCLREYRRASSAAIDASGFDGRLLLITSSGGVMDLPSVVEAPIHMLKSGPAMAPIAGRYYAKVDADSDTVLVADTGGTSYDVSLVRRGKIPGTRETWLGPEWTGHITGLPSIDVRSIGAGGGSVAWIDDGGMLHVGPDSAGAVPGPACYGKGGTRATVTDASVVLGHIDPDYFLGGAMRLDRDTAVHAVDEHVGRPLGLDSYAAAWAIMQVTTEQMVQLIEDLSVNQGVDPRTAVMIGGGGAAGLNAVSIARRLGCPRVIIPQTGAVLSAFGALLSDLSAEYAVTFVTTSASFDFEGVNRVLDDLAELSRAFIDGPGKGAVESHIEFSAEMRYPSEVWELEVPLRTSRFETVDDVEQLREDLHTARLEIFGISDPSAPAHVVTWRAKVSCRLGAGVPGKLRGRQRRDGLDTSRTAYFPGRGAIQTPVRHFDVLQMEDFLPGPAIVESSVTTVVIDQGAVAERTASGSLLVTIQSQ